MSVAVEEKNRLEEIWGPPKSPFGWFGMVTHKEVGLRYIITAFVFFLVGGISALFMRTQLAVPENDFLGPDTYNELFTMHGTTMMFLFAVPIAEGFGAYMVPLMIGARDLAFPRLNAFGYWCFLLGGLFLYSSFLVGTVPDMGWFAYVPLSSDEFSPDRGVDFWLLGITFVEISSLVAATELAVSILRFRAPGLSLNRLPIFVWAVLAIAFAIIFGFPPLIVGGLMLELDRSLGTQFFDTAQGGSALLWQHLFWIFGHPEVYIQFLPAAGIISTVIPTFAQRPMVTYMLVVLSVLATAVLSFGLWVHHMYATGLPALALAFFTASSLSVAIPSGVQVFAWVGTLWGTRPAFTTSLLFAVGTVVTFVIGGITGVMVAMVPLDWQVHDTFFVVAHFHYVLIGAVVFPVFAGFYYWFPKFTGRLLSEGWGKANFWLVFLGFHITFFPMHIVGIMGMPRRVYTYEEGLGWATLNLIETCGAFTIAVGVSAFLINVVLSARSGKEAGPNPWHGGTLEWGTSSPPASYNFETNPPVRGRYPVWEEGPPVEPVMGTPPVDRRETLVTSVLDARPQAIVWIPGSSYAPFALALATGVVFVGALLYLPLMMLVGVLLFIAGAAVWAWPDAKTRHARPGGTSESGLQYELHGWNSTDWWGVASFILIFGTAFASLVGSYYYLLSDAPLWPPPGIDEPELLIPCLAATAAVCAAGTMFLATRLRPAGGGVLMAMLLALLLGGAFIAGVARDQLGVEFDLTEHAYTSLYFVLGWFAVAMVGIAWLMTLYALAQWLFLNLEGALHVSLDIAALFWYFAALVAVVTVGVVYISPLVL